VFVENECGVDDTEIEKMAPRIRLVAQDESRQTQQHLDLNLTGGVCPASIDSVAEKGQERVGLLIVSLVVERFGSRDIRADIVLKGSLKYPGRQADNYGKGNMRKPHQTPLAQSIER